VSITLKAALRYAATEIDHVTRCQLDRYAQELRFKEDDPKIADQKFAHYEAILKAWRAETLEQVEREFIAFCREADGMVLH
jgi:hypothetical protein